MPTAPLDVQLVTGFLPSYAFTSVLTEVSAASGSPASNIAPVRVGVEFTYAYEAGRSVATFANLAHGTYMVRVHLYKRDGQLLSERRVQINHTGANVLRVHLTEDCLHQEPSCPAPSASPQLTECLQGHCVDARCNPEDSSTHAFCPSVVFCHSDSECPALEGVSECIANKCASGICIPSHLSGAIEGPHGTTPCNGA